MNDHDPSYCLGCFAYDFQECECPPPRKGYLFELEYGTATVLVGPCSGEDRDELIKLWGREPDAGRAIW